MIDLLKMLLLYRASEASRANARERASEMSRVNASERGKDCVNKFIRAILNEYKYCEKIMKDHFNKNLIMSMEEERYYFKKQINVGFAINYLN